MTGHTPSVINFGKIGLEELMLILRASQEMKLTGKLVFHYKAGSIERATREENLF